MITYQDLYKANPEVARQKVIEVWEELDGNVKKTARELQCSKNTVKKAVARHKAGVSLKDFSRRPNRHSDQTPLKWEEIVIAERKKTGFGRIRLERQIREKYGKKISTHTIRNILRRGNIPKKRRKRGIYATPHVYDLSQIPPLTHWQVDVKEIFDYKALGREIYEYFELHAFPPYQWTAIDPKTKIKFLGYSFEKTLANGNAFRILLSLWLRLFGIDGKFFFQTDGGVEFGAESLEKLDRIQKKIFDPLNIQLGRIRLGQPQDNAYVERTHRTDDEEFYVPKGMRFETVPQFMEGASEYLLCFNTRRWHYGREMNGKTPLQRLKELRPDVSQNICKFPVLLLDQISSDKAFIGGHDVPAYYQDAGFRVIGYIV